MGGKCSIAIPGHIYVSFLDRPVPPKTGQEPPAASAAPHRCFLSGAYNWALKYVILNKKNWFWRRRDWIPTFRLHHRRPQTVGRFKKCFEEQGQHIRNH